MILLNEVFNPNRIRVNHFNKKYFLIIIIILIILVLLCFLVKKDYYYENILIKNQDNIILLVDKNMINTIKNKNELFINSIQNNYSINKIVLSEDIYYVYVNIIINIENIENTQYKIFLGKETIIEYIIRVIRKVS